MLKNYRFTEPAPPRPRLRLWPATAAAAATMAAMFGLWPFYPGWNLLPFIGWLIFDRIWSRRTRRQVGAWMQAHDDWQRRMEQFYAQPWEQRDKAMWS